ncbi:MAG: transporter substrate-binding domain-containing protein [Prevotellaceae bacterium]|jgi:membrane-bound lytic murein transglycosylase MltF|nr:transporter substrate-binding domain-containing protein [Prevotellaceae bacterium]
MGHTKLKKSIVLLLMIGGLLFVGLLANVFLKKAIRHNTLIVVIDSGQPLYTERYDSIFGLQYEIVRTFADSAKMELDVLRKNDLKQSIDLLRARKCDIVAVPIPTTTEYIDHVAFTVPLLFERQVLVQRKDSVGQVLKKQYELANDTIMLPTNSPQIQRIRNLSDEIADTIFISEIPNLSPEQLVAEVANGTYKYTICNERLAKKMQKQFDNIDCSMPVGFVQSYSWAVNIENQKLLTKLNNFLETFIKSDTYKAIHEKYE